MVSDQEFASGDAGAAERTELGAKYAGNEDRRFAYLVLASLAGCGLGFAECCRRVVEGLSDVADDRLLRPRRHLFATLVQASGEDGFGGRRLSALFEAGNCILNAGEACALNVSVDEAEGGGLAAVFASCASLVGDGH